MQWSCKNFVIIYNITREINFETNSRMWNSIFIFKNRRYRELVTLIRIKLSIKKHTWMQEIRHASFWKQVNTICRIILNPLVFIRSQKFSSNISKLLELANKSRTFAALAERCSTIHVYSENMVPWLQRRTKNRSALSVRKLRTNLENC